MDPDGSSTSDDEPKSAAEVAQLVTSGVCKILDALSVTSSCCSSDTAKAIIQKTLRQSPCVPVDSEIVVNVRKRLRLRETSDLQKTSKPKGLLRSPNHFPHHSPYQPYVLDDSAGNSPPPDEMENKKKVNRPASANEQFETDKDEQREVIKKENSKNGNGKDVQSLEVSANIDTGHTGIMGSLENRHLYKHHHFGDSDQNDAEIEKKSPRKVKIPDAEEVVNILSQIVSEKRHYQSKPPAKRMIITNKSPQEPGTRPQPNNSIKMKMSHSIAKEMEVICKYLQQAKQAKSSSEESRKNMTDTSDAIIQGNNKEALENASLPKRENPVDGKTSSDSSSLNVTSEEFKVPLAPGIRRQNPVYCKGNEHSPPVEVEAKVNEAKEEETLLLSISPAEDDLHQRKSLRLRRSKTTLMDLPEQVFYIPTFAELQRKKKEKKKREKFAKAKEHIRKNKSPIGVSDTCKQNSKVEEVEPRKATLPETSKPSSENPQVSSNNVKECHTRCKALEKEEKVKYQNRIEASLQTELDEGKDPETLSDIIVKTAIENLRKSEATTTCEKWQEPTFTEASTEIAETLHTPPDAELNLAEDVTEGGETVRTTTTEDYTPSSNHNVTHLVNLAENVGSPQYSAFVTNELEVNPRPSLAHCDTPVQSMRQFRNRRTQTRETLELACVHSPTYATLKRYNPSEAEIPPEYLTVMCGHGAISSLSYRENPSQKLKYSDNGENGYSSSGGSVSNKSLVVLYWNTEIKYDKSQVSQAISRKDQKSVANLGCDKEPYYSEPQRDSAASFEKLEALCKSFTTEEVSDEYPVNCGDLRLNIEDLGEDSSGSSNMPSRRGNHRNDEIYNGTPRNGAQSSVDQLSPGRIIISVELKSCRQTDTTQSLTKKVEVYNEDVEAGNNFVIENNQIGRIMEKSNPLLRQEGVENLKTSSELHEPNKSNFDVDVRDSVVEEQKPEKSSMIVTYVNEKRMEISKSTSCEDSHMVYERKSKRKFNRTEDYLSHVGAQYGTDERKFKHVEDQKSDKEATLCVNDPMFCNPNGINSIYEDIFQEKSRSPSDMWWSHGSQGSIKDREKRSSHQLNEQFQERMLPNRNKRESAGYEVNNETHSPTEISRAATKGPKLKNVRASSHFSGKSDDLTQPAYVKHKEKCKYSGTSSMFMTNEWTTKKTNTTTTINSMSVSGSSKTKSGLLEASKSQRKHKSQKVPMYLVQRIDVESCSRNKIKREDCEKALAGAQHKNARKKHKMSKISHKYSRGKCLWHDNPCSKDPKGRLETVSVTEESTTTQESSGLCDELLMAKERKLQAYKLMAEIGERYFLKPIVCETDDDTTHMEHPKRSKVVIFKVDDSVPKLPVGKHFLEPIVCDDEEVQPSSYMEKRPKAARRSHTHNRTVDVPTAGQHFLQPQICESVGSQRPERLHSPNFFIQLNTDYAFRTGNPLIHIASCNSLAHVRHKRHPDIR